MKLYQLKVKIDKALRVIRKFRELGKGHFVGLNKDKSPDSLEFTMQIDQWEEALRKVEVIQELFNKHTATTVPPESYKESLKKFRKFRYGKKKAIPILLDEVHKDICEFETFF